jgi:hypothetical protein
LFDLSILFLLYQAEFDDREEVKQENIFGWWGGEQ